jgi:hypothetical protein
MKYILILLLAVAAAIGQTGTGSIQGTRVLTVESTDAPEDHPRATILIHRTFGTWGMGGVAMPVEPEKQK